VLNIASSYTETITKDIRHVQGHFTEVDVPVVALFRKEKTITQFFKSYR